MIILVGRHDALTGRAENSSSVVMLMNDKDKINKYILMQEDDYEIT